MKKFKISVMILFTSLFMFSCSNQNINSEQKPELEKWQEDILTAENLPLDTDQLTELQKTRLNSIFEMEEYLRSKYSEEFVYLEYIPADLLESEKLLVYPQMAGEGDGSNIVTVKRNQNGKLTDDYYDYSVAEYSRKLINDFLLSNFKEEDYLYKASTNACNITKSEITDGDFKWEFGASNIIFIRENACSIDDIEKFAVKYAKFLYEHRIDGSHRINIFPECESDDYRWYEHYDYIGSYCISFSSEKFSLEKDKVNIDCLKMDGELRSSEKYNFEEYFSKFDNTSENIYEPYSLQKYRYNENAVRLREFIYDASELNYNLPDDTRDFIMIKGKLISYSEYGYEENENSKDSLKEEDYKSEMIIEGDDGSHIKCYFSGSPLDSRHDNAFEQNTDYKKIGYILGKEYNIKSFIGKEVILAGKYIKETNQVVFCRPVSENDADSYYYSRKKELADWKENGIKCEDLAREFTEEIETGKDFPVNFYSKYQGVTVKLTGLSEFDKETYRSFVQLRIRTRKSYENYREVYEGVINYRFAWNSENEVLRLRNVIFLESWDVFDS